MYCQKCRTPLRLDGSLEDLNPAAYDLLVATSQPTIQRSRSSRPLSLQDKARRSLYDRVSKEAGPAMFRKSAAATGGGGAAGGPRLSEAQQRDNPGMSFIYLTESQVVPAGRSHGRGAPPQSAAEDVPSDYDDTKSREMERITKLHEILSARSDIDHPVCVECTEMLVEGLQKKLETANREREAYVGYLKQLQADAPTDEELKATEDSLKTTTRSEAEALELLRKLEQEKAELDDQILRLEDESKQLDADEEQFWRDRNAFAMKLTEFQNERDSLNSKYDHDSRLLEKLRRSNVYNDTFCISFDGYFATINSLRLGRLSNRPVDWPEINAAWGHALLLLVTVADKLDYKFEGYEPVPMGSTSKIIRSDPVSPASSRLGNRNAPPPAPKKHVLELYSSGDMPLGLTFMHRKFDNAMVAFLELVKQLGVLVEKRSASRGADLALTLPYKIEGDKIEDVSIKLGLAQDDSWTRACKLTLTCCKFLLACSSNMSAERGGRGNNGNGG
ncbi:autophagy protein Apg6-domain-containing protein [Coniella lustricola]|uniref:Autophagy protein Apg6-domain-containing protein n=1 Tax=Coniella lustricola TaxID=2025994 RepID=A0A2T2ZYT2_9PEZI|nr:autophagy protein Apg6-domain-containing protein [Coniella lustricola]